MLQIFVNMSALILYSLTSQQRRFLIAKWFFTKCGKILQWSTLIFMQPCLLDDFLMVAIEYIWKS